MKVAIDNLTKKVVSNELLWKGLWPFVRAFNYLQYHRGVVKREVHHQNLDKSVVQLLGTAEVKNGPFKGMKYPGFFSYGSTLFPKLLGSYEQELHPIIERICSKRYAAVLDIGSAEGYYAVGFALRLANTPVYAFDIEETANTACAQMAALNNVADRVKMAGLCSSALLADFDFGAGGLVVCDCEGYEKELFTGANVANLQRCDLLIETHDFIDINISDYLKALFGATHSITSIYSIDDIAKARSYSVPEIGALDLKQRKEVLAEKRPAIMEWLYLEPKGGSF